MRQEECVDEVASRKLGQWYVLIAVNRKKGNECILISGWCHRSLVLELPFRVAFQDLSLTVDKGACTVSGQELCEGLDAYDLFQDVLTRVA